LVGNLKSEPNLRAIYGSYLWKAPKTAEFCSPRLVPRAGTGREAQKSEFFVSFLI